MLFSCPSDPRGSESFRNFYSEPSKAFRHMKLDGTFLLTPAWTNTPAKIPRSSGSCKIMITKTMTSSSVRTVPAPAQMPTEAQPQEDTGSLLVLQHCCFSIPAIPAEMLQEVCDTQEGFTDPVNELSNAIVQLHQGCQQMSLQWLSPVSPMLAWSPLLSPYWPPPPRPALSTATSIHTSGSWLSLLQ